VSSGDAVFRRVQSLARSAAANGGTGAPTQEYLIRHTLESFLDRLTRTSHADDFVLKGGVLLAAYGARRPTKDADSNAVHADVTAEHLAQVVRDIAATDVDDGVVFDLDTISGQEIREQADYPGLRVRVAVSIGPWKGAAAWDVSTGDPIVPPPREVTIDRILGDPITLLGYAPETTIAEKGVTILERGITSTRWRDYVDIVQLARHGINPDELLRSARAVARHPRTRRTASGRLRRSRTSEMGRMAPQGTPRIRMRGEPRRPDHPGRRLPRLGLCARPRIDRRSTAATDLPNIVELKGFRSPGPPHRQTGQTQRPGMIPR
jgi:Nucleotidyl transferase AbiEii toxin, Type IV TA system